MACATGRARNVSLLLEERTTINSHNIFGFNPLHIAVEARHVTVVDTFLSHDISCLEMLDSLRTGTSRSRARNKRRDS